MKGSKKLKVIGFIIAILILVLSIVFISANKLEKMKIQKLSAENKKALTYGQLTEQDAKVDNCDYIEFSAFFLRDLNNDGYAERIKGTCKEIGTTDTLYLDFNVLTKGYLKDGKITVNGGNFVWTTSIVDDKNIVDGNYIGQTSSIKLKDEIKNGSQKLFYGTISSKIGNNINNYSKVNSVTLTGTYVDEEGKETPINKTSNVTVDWYGTTKTEVNKYYYNASNYTMYDNQMYDIATAIIENSVNIDFKVAISELNKDLILQKQEVEIEIPKLNGYEATEVISTDKDVTYAYDNKSRKIKITKESKKDSSGNITTIARSNLYSVKAVYPLEAYTTMDENSVALNIPIVGYNYGYNNNDKNFENPHVSNKTGIVTITYSNPVGEIWNVETYIGNKVYINQNYKYVVSKELVKDIYNGNSFENLVDQYPVEWKVVTKEYEKLENIILEEQNENKSDNFLNNSNQYINMHDYITTTGIYFSNATTMLGENGWIKLYNAETDALLETFTNRNWNDYNKFQPYEVNLKSIKVETSAPIAETYFSVIQIKKIDDELIAEKYTKEEFEKLSYIYTYLKGTAQAAEGIAFEDGNSISEINRNNFAYYEFPESVQILTTSNFQISNQETKNMNLYIQTNSENVAESKWKNGVFLLELPEDILDIEIKKISSSVNDVKILSYNVYEQNGKKYIKIYTENETEQVYRITVNVDITANPLKPTSTQNIKLYAYNEKSDNYRSKTKDIFDIDNDGKFDDEIGYSSYPISLVAPSGLLTTEYITNYDDLGSVTIAPNIAEIDNEVENKKATININVTNNYNGTISEVKILGKTPFKGNTYVIKDEALNSDFTASMNGAISIPEELKQVAKIYYSENENPNKDISDESNRWKAESEIQDYSKIKTYLIDFGDYRLAKDEKRAFSYDINLPKNISNNDVAFSAHAVYYCLDTENGKLETKTEPNKVGIQVVSKFNFELTKSKKTFENMLVKGATYKVSTFDANGKDISKIETTDENGTIKFNNLYIEREYSLKEVASPTEYILNEQEIKFIAKVNEQNKLVFEVVSGEFLGHQEIVVDENGLVTVKAKVEDEAKYNLVINKKDENGNALGNVKFVIEGKDKTNKIYKTNSNGQIVIEGLFIDEEYKIRETTAEGYYIDKEDRIFKVTRNEEGTLEVVTQDELLKNIKLTEQENQPLVLAEIDIQNEKIPTYNLQILKVEQSEEENLENLKSLQGADFVLFSNDTERRTEYVTDENGYIQIDNLYQFIEGKYITGEYLLQELKAPAGYSNNAEEINFKVIKDDTGLKVEIENKDNLVTLKDTIIEGNTIKLIIQDKPLFKLTKVDSETGEVLANAKFVIYEINDKGGEIDFAKDVNGNYVGELDENEQYVVTTDDKGVITLPLRDGLYKAIEIGFPEGYQEKSNEEVFRVGEIEISDNNSNVFEEIIEVVEINYIEDLVDLSNNVNNGKKYSDSIVNLNRTLDFKNTDSYKNSNSISYGDLNQNGKIETIIEELTNEDGIGFTPIGESYNYCFEGIFDGKGNEIKNIYINSNASNIGLFGYVQYAEISNLGISGNLISDVTENCTVGGVVGYVSLSYIKNCNNNMNIIINNATNNVNDIKNKYVKVGGIIGCGSVYLENCCNKGFINADIDVNCYIGGIVGDFTYYSILKSYNLGEINVTSANKSYIGGIVGYSDGFSYGIDGIINNCYNLGDVEGNAKTFAYIGGIVGYNKESSIDNTYNVRKCD